MIKKEIYYFILGSKLKGGGLKSRTIHISSRSINRFVQNFANASNTTLWKFGNDSLCEIDSTTKKGGGGVIDLIHVFVLLRILVIISVAWS